MRVLRFCRFLSRKGHEDVLNSDLWLYQCKFWAICSTFNLRCFENDFLPWIWHSYLPIIKYGWSEQNLIFYTQVKHQCNRYPKHHGVFLFKLEIGEREEHCQIAQWFTAKNPHCIWMSVSTFLLRSGYFMCRYAVSKLLCLFQFMWHFYVLGCVFIRILSSILLPAIENENGEKYTV